MRLRRTIAVAFGLAALAALPASASSGVPAVGTKAEKADLRSVPGAIPYEGAWALPLEGAVPSWYTEELHRQVIEAEGQPVALPHPAGRDRCGGRIGDLEHVEEAVLRPGG